MPDPSGTIVSEATPPGRGAVRVLRLSGPEALRLLDALFEPESGPQPSLRPRSAVLGSFRGATGGALDRCLALAFPAPASFTGEDCAELHLHGSPGLLREALGRCVQFGARPALPGEFSYRAFLAGKLSLLQAEAIDALTACETGGQARRFSPGAARSLEVEVRRMADGLADLEAQMEACVDFPEETAGSAGFQGLLVGLQAELAALANDGLRSRPLREGWKVALVGAPNVGKSSLFNALLKRERALVSPHPGTTRDVLAETLEVGGLPLTLLDTAGGGETADPLDRLGVEAGGRAAAEADGLLLVYDASRGWSDADRTLLESSPSPPLALLANKADLPPGGPPPPGFTPLRTSAVEGSGLDALLRLLALWMEGTVSGDRAMPMSARQAGAALDASRSMARALGALEGGFTEEVALQGVREALRCLGDLLGGGDPETLYDRIFAQFCLGK